ncbi:MAG: hypothetical protein WBZ08_22670 [Pseudolabrys sp.]
MARDGATIFSDLIGVAENTIEGVAENQKIRKRQQRNGLWRELSKTIASSYPFPQTEWRFCLRGAA